jgi:magnesium chelatase family protein
MLSQCSLTSAILHGVQAVPITVEVAVTSGLPGMAIVGMADTAVQEARERVRAAIRAAGFSMPNEKIVVNLAPGSMRKNGSGFDLPIALGILVATHQLSPNILEKRLFIGELSLEGQVRHVSGLLAFGMLANELGFELVSAGVEYVPLDNLVQLGLTSLFDLRGNCPFFDVEYQDLAIEKSATVKRNDFEDVAGHDIAKRAIQIAVAGEHGILMMGPPGSGKTMLASRVASILPPLTQQEMLEAALVHSVAGESIDSILNGVRPFRSPHHSATCAGLVGGGSPIRPGEVSLAHRGVLFLDELAEFKPASLQSLRQPMESGQVCLTRATGNILFPARFMLVAAANPCPCGYFGDTQKTCTCSQPKIEAYQGRIGGPLMDRIDIQIDVCRLPPSNVLKSGKGTSSAQLREGVLAAKEFKRWRIGKGIGCADENEQLRSSVDTERKTVRKSSKDIIASCLLSAETSDFLVEMAESYSLSGRAIVSILNVSRTIADISQCENVQREHLAEALSYRVRDGIGVMS